MIIYLLLSVSGNKDDKNNNRKKILIEHG